MPQFNVDLSPDDSNIADPNEQEFVAQVIGPVTPAMATPQNLLDVVNQYARYLQERRETKATPETETRLKKVESSVRYCETTINYWMGYLYSDPSDIVSDCKVLIATIRTENKGHYTVPSFRLNIARTRPAAQNARTAPQNATPSQRATRPPNVAPDAPAAHQPPPTPAQRLAALAQTGLFDRMEDDDDE